MSPDARKRAHDATVVALQEMAFAIGACAATQEERLVLLEQIATIRSLCDFGMADGGEAVFPTLQTQVRR